MSTDTIFTDKNGEKHIGFTKHGIDVIYEIEITSAFRKTYSRYVCAYCAYDHIEDTGQQPTAHPIHAPTPCGVCGEIVGSDLALDDD